MHITRHRRPARHWNRGAIRDRIAFLAVIVIALLADSLANLLPL